MNGEILRSVPWMDGWHAQRLGGSSKVNPYDEARQSFSRAQWCSGWSARHDCLKHGYLRAHKEVLDGTTGYGV